jgi:protein TonB
VEVARSSSHRALDQAAVRAVRRWRFEPATRQGRPVSQVVQVPVAFSP